MLSRIAALVLAVFVMVGTGTQETDIPTGVLGFAECSPSVGTPTSWVRIDLIRTNPKFAELVMAHEEDHVEVMLSYESCEAYQKARAAGGLDFRIALEARAFCAEARVGVEIGYYRDMEQALEASAYALSNYYLFGLDQDQARAEILKNCTPQ